MEGRTGRASGAVWNADGPERDGVQTSHPPPMTKEHKEHQESLYKIELICEYLTSNRFDGFDCKITMPKYKEDPPYLIITSNKDRNYGRHVVTIRDGEEDKVSICNSGDYHADSSTADRNGIRLSLPQSLEMLKSAVDYCLRVGNCAHCPIKSPFYEFTIVGEEFE